MFGDDQEKKPDHLGQASIYYKTVGSILNPTSGFMDTYDFTLNPYSGCAFGCTYCYAAFFARDSSSRRRAPALCPDVTNVTPPVKSKAKKPPASFKTQ